jgi:spore coat-associated protein N
MEPEDSDRRRRLVGRVALTLLVLGCATGLVMATTYAAWTGSANQNNQIASGTISITLGATGGATNRLDINASSIAPGDTIKRSVDLINPSGNMDLSSITLTTAASPSSLLDTDTVNGLQMQIDRCSQAWTETGTSPAFSYSCGGTTVPVLGVVPVIQTNAALSNLSALTNNNTDHLLVTLTLGGSSTSLQGLTSSITYTFTGTQRAAGPR